MSKPPKPKQFDSSKYTKTINFLDKNISELEFERLSEVVTPNILHNYERFTDVIKGPDFRGTPFDFLGYKDDQPHIIEFKGSLNSFNTLGETQKRRLQEILSKVGGLHIALLRLKLKKSQYRIIYDDEIEILFEGKHAPIEPIVDWVKEKLN